jgi:hypothetical protein
MPMTPLKLDDGCSGLFRRFVEKKVCVHFLGPTREMFRSGIRRDSELTAFEGTIVSNLMAVIGGISTICYPSHGRDSGMRFQRTVIDHYPWSCEPTVDIDRPSWAATLYYRYRNPFAHALGIDDEQRSIKSTRIPYRSSKRLRGYSEAELTRLESSVERPDWPETLRFNSLRILLHTEGLYWGTRRLIESASSNGNCMIAAHKFLRSSAHW